MKSRREFLQLSSFGVASSILPSFDFQNSILKRRMSIQLYTIRNQIEKDLEGSIKKLADLGFNYVETAFWPKNISLEKAAEVLKKNHLKVSSCHIELPIGEQKNQFLKTAQVFECQNMIWHGWPEDPRYSSLEGTKELVKIYQSSNQFAKDHGLTFGLHNHWWEFRNKVGGKFVYEILLEELDPEIFFEIDTYWVKVAGHNPAEIVKKFGKRVKLMHIKDGPAEFNDRLLLDNPDAMTPVGKGVQNFPDIFQSASSACDWLVIEMDQTAIEVFEAIQQSVDYLRPYVRE